MSSEILILKPVTDRLSRMDQAALRRRTIVFVICCVVSYGVWIAIRWQPIPGTQQPLWSIPLWGKALLLGSLTFALFALFRLGGWLIRDSRKLYVASTGVRSSNVSVRWYRYLNPIGLLYNLYLHRDLLRQFVRREIEARYRGSSLGLVWSLVTPLLMLAIYTFVFSVIFNARWRGEGGESQGTFAVTLFAGLIAFGVFSEMVNRAPTLIVSHPNYVKKVVFPLEILSASALGAALFQALVNVAILIAAHLLIAGTMSATIVQLPVAAIPLIGLSLGLSWFLASLGVYVRDIAYLVGLVTQVLFFMSAIFYPIEAVPEAVRPIMRLNPLTTIVDSFRRTLVWGEPLEWDAWLVTTLFAGVVLLVGYMWFMKTKSGFADVI